MSFGSLIAHPCLLYTSKAVISYIQAAEGTDLQHLYIDGSKFEANANKYTWVWKKATEKSRYRLFDKITTLLTDCLLYTSRCV